MVDGDAGDAYYGYFENEHGEQAIYRYDYETAEATVRMGDAGLETGWSAAVASARRWLGTGR